MLASHGIAGGPGVAARHAERLSASGHYRSVHAACLHGAPSLEDVLGSMPDGRVEVLPLLIADGHTMAGLRRRASAYRNVELGAPIGERPGFDALILEKAEAHCAARGWAPGGVTLLLVGHGSARFPGSGRAVRRHVMACAARGRFAGVAGALLEERPHLGDVITRPSERPCVVLGLFMDEGPHGRDDVLEALARARGPALYAGAVGSDERLLSLILDGAGATKPAAA